MRPIRVLTFILAIGLTVMLTVSCDKSRRQVQSVSQADSLIESAYQARDYVRLIVLADTLETQRNLSEVKADYWRGYAYSRLRQMRSAEISWKKAVEDEIKTDEDLEYYSKSANRLASLLLLKGDFEETMRVAVAALNTMEQKGSTDNSDFANLLSAVGSCQLKLDRKAEAANSFERAYRKYEERIAQDPSNANFTSAIIGIITTTDNYLTSKYFEEARAWTERFADLLSRYEKVPDANPETLDKQRARLHFYQASALEGLGYPKEAAKAYREAQKTTYAKTGDGRIESTDYLIAAHRWAECANNFSVLDDQMNKYGIELSFDKIQQYYVPKFKANVGAGRHDSVIAVGLQICTALDSAIVRQKKDDAAELATIYGTQQKEAQIAQQRADLSRQRMISTLVILVFVSLYFVVYVYIKRKAARRLEEAHQKLEDAHSKLQTAYGQLEETTKAKERYESELRIASDIQQSMLPSVLPDASLVDLCGAMTPAKEVGGDLYDFLIEDNRLYVCLGDVSGKGVPASLFMAQAIRMFRALAKQGIMPAEIANGLNDELVLGNENGMFVTMFIGLIDLKTGRMDFCNAGHNPPVLNGEFLQMESNAPIGLWENLEYVGEHIDSIKGQTFFIYSDGLNEAENSQQQQFGDDRILAIIRGSHFENSRQLIDTLGHEVEQHRDGAEPNDDLTMLCLRIP